MQWNAPQGIPTLDASGFSAWRLPSAEARMSADAKAPKFKRCKITREQLLMLIQSFDAEPFPNFDKRQLIAQKLDMTPRSVQIWFQNRRQRLLKPKEGRGGAADADGDAPDASEAGDLGDGAEDDGAVHGEGSTSTGGSSATQLPRVDSFNMRPPQSQRSNGSFTLTWNTPTGPPVGPKAGDRPVPLVAPPAAPTPAPAAPAPAPAAPAPQHSIGNFMSNLGHVFQQQQPPSHPPAPAPSLPPSMQPAQGLLPTPSPHPASALNPPERMVEDMLHELPAMDSWSAPAPIQQERREPPSLAATHSSLSTISNSSSASFRSSRTNSLNGGSPTPGQEKLTNLVSRLGGLLMGNTCAGTELVAGSLPHALATLPQAVAAGHVSPEAATLLLVLLYEKN